MQHAVRQTLVADALTLQLKLPPAGVPAPVARSSPTVAGGAPVVDVLAVTSVWAVHILRSLSQASFLRGLPHMEQTFLRLRASRPHQCPLAATHGT